MKHLFALLVALLASLYVTASNPVGLICTYNYRQTLEQDNVNTFDTSKPVELSYVVASTGGDSTKFTTYATFEDLLKGYIKGRNLLVYVHGDHSLLSELLKIAPTFASTYNSDLLMFVWPSNSVENRSIKNYNQSKDNSVAVLPNFAQIVDTLSSYCQKNDINCTVMFHSLGNLFAKNFARYSVRNGDFKRLAINNILLNAACVWEDDHDIWVDILSNRIRGKVYITQNRSDQILALANHFIEFGNLLGMTKPVVSSKNAVYLDFTDVLRRFANTYESHGYFFGPLLNELPQIKTVYQHIIDDNELAFLTDNNIVEASYAPNYYSILPRKR